MNEIKFTEAQRESIIVENSDKPLIGITGFDLRMFYDEESIQTEKDLGEAVAQLAKGMMQFILDDKYGPAGTVTEEPGPLDLPHKQLAFGFLE